MLLLNWRANCDMRLIICEKSLIRYLLKYVSKAETKSDALSEIMSNLINLNKDNLMGPQSLIQKILNKYIGERDYSQMEMIRIIRQMSLYDTNFFWTYINLEPYSEIT